MSASFTLASPGQCQGGSPRFDVVTMTGLFFLGCNNVMPTINANGSATYTFTAATLAAGGNQVPFPTGTINAIDILIDVQGTARRVGYHGQRRSPGPGFHRAHVEGAVQERRVEDAQVHPQPRDSTGAT